MYMMTQGNKFQKNLIHVQSDYGKKDSNKRELVAWDCISIKDKNFTVA